jgi:hypothetical protein
MIGSAPGYELSGLDCARLGGDYCPSGIDDCRLQLHRQKRVLPIGSLVNAEEGDEPFTPCELATRRRHDG